MADNLESYFKKHLSKATPDKDNWNVPSDDVWDKVLPKISKKKGLFIPWKYLYILGFIVLAGLAFILWPTDESKPSFTEADKEITSEKNPVQFPIDHTILPNDDADNTRQETRNTETLSNKAEIVSANAISSSQKSTQTAKITSSTSKNPNSARSGQNELHHAPFQNDLLHELPIQSGDKIEIASVSSKSINLSLPLSETSLLKKHHVFLDLPVDMEKKKPESFNNKGKFGIGVFFKPTYTSTYLNGELNQGVIETRHVFLYASNWGFEVKYHFSNKLTLVTGVEKSEIRSWSKSLVDFGYDTSTEYVMETGEKENTSPVPMPTPFGEIDTEITYRFSSNQEIPDGEMMHSILETHQDVRYLSIPLGLEYNMMRFSNINWFIEGGITYNRALRDATSFTSRVLHKGHDMTVVGENMTSYPSYTLNYISFYAGTGVSYQFSNSLQLNASARYFGSITKVNLQENLSTYVQGFNFKIGIVYIF